MTETTALPGRASSGITRKPEIAGQVWWGTLLVPPAILSLALLVLPQASFILMSFHEDIGLGQVSETFTVANYLNIITDPVNLRSIWLTIHTSAAATAVGLLLGFPTAYALARLGGWTARLALSLILATSLITIVIKLLGLNLLLGSSGPINQFLVFIGLVAAPIALVNNQLGVLIGLVQYTLPVLILMLFSVAQTIPSALEEAATIHGATRMHTFFRIVLPLARPGLVGSGLISFNMSMGAFTSAALLGGGRVRTMPVLIQEKMMQSTDYGMGAALSTVLLILVFIINVVIATMAMRRRRVASGR
jgi:putative spermidine/putrescine transport system permease protein